MEKKLAVRMAYLKAGPLVNKKAVRRASAKVGMKAALKVLMLVDSLEISLDLS